jgi:hypothetical protein
MFHCRNPSNVLVSWKLRGTSLTGRHASVLLISMPLLDIGEALKSMSDIPFTQRAPGIAKYFPATSRKP